METGHVVLWSIHMIGRLSHTRFIYEYWNWSRDTNKASWPVGISRPCDQINQVYLSVQVVFHMRQFPNSTGTVVNWRIAADLNKRTIHKASFIASFSPAAFEGPHPPWNSCSTALRGDHLICLVVWSDDEYAREKQSEHRPKHPHRE